MATIHNLNAERRRRQAIASAPKRDSSTARRKPIPLKRKRARRNSVSVDHQFNLHQISSEPEDDAPPSA